MLASLRRFAGLVLLWSIPGVAVGLQSKAWEQEMGPWGTYRFLYVYAGWVIWAFLTPPLAWLVRRFTVERYGLLRLGALHVVTCTAFVFFQEGCLALLTRVIGPYSMQRMTLGDALWDSVAKSAFLDTMVYVMTVGVLLAIDLRRKLRAQELTGARLQAELAKAELDALAGAAPSALPLQHAERDLDAGPQGRGRHRGADDRRSERPAPARAGHRRAAGGAAPRRSWISSSATCLQQIRFPDRLQIRMKIDPDTLEARVPSLVLQPLAENAVRHGIAPSIAGGSVEVAAVREGEELVLRVRDTGVGLHPGSESSGGVGLRNVRARLQHLYPGQHRFRVANRVEGGVESLLAIPFRGAEVVRA